MSEEPSGNMVFDTGPLLEIVSGSKLGAYTTKLLQSGMITGLLSEISLAELRYLICRKSSEQKSEQVLKYLRDSRRFKIFPFEDYEIPACNMKCKRSLSIADCFVLSIGESMKCPVLFASRETELLKEIKRKAFETKILFLDEITRTSLASTVTGQAEYHQ